MSSALVLSACGGDDPATNNANNGNTNTNNNTTNNNTANNNTTNNNTVTDTTPPTVAITDDVADATATGDVTFTFTFSESIVVDFGADDIMVTGGVPGAFTVVDDTVSRLVVSPTADTVGTIMVSVAAGAFEDLAGNLNVEAASASQAYDTSVVVMLQQMSLPVTFDAQDVDYGLQGFGGAEDATVVPDPTDGTNRVAKVVKSGAAETWAGVTLTDDGTRGFSAKIPFDVDNTRMSVRVYSPDAGIAVRLKVEDSTDATVSVETEAMTTAVDTWEVLTFEFVTPVNGTSSLSFDATYDKATIFFNFGVDGATAGEKTYHFDDVVFVGGTTTGPTGDFSSLTFDDAAVSYTFTDFGGSVGTIVVDPTDSANMVGQVTKSDTAELWAGVTVSTGPNDSVGRFPVDAANTRLTLRVWSPDAGVPVRVKIEDATDPTVSVESEVMTTTAGAWETLTIDFASQVAGTAAVNFAANYNKISTFFNFGTTGADAGEKTYYFDDIIWIGGTGGGTPGTFVDLTFDDAAVTYTFTDFGGSVGTVVADPTDSTNMAAQVVKSNTAELWAGVTVSTGPLDSVGQFPVDAANTRLTMRVWSPDAGVPVRLKIEDATDPTVSVETEVMTTTAGAWETLTFDFATQAMGTAAINFGATYNKISAFFNFGTTGADAGEKTYYFDDIVWIGGTGSGTGGGNFVDLTFDDAAKTYAFASFGGATGTVVVDPTDATNMVGEVVKSNVAELWAGVTPSTGPMDSVETLPVDAANTRLTIRVWSPDANIPVRVKIEDAADPTRSVEAEAMTTVASAWETLTIDFASEVSGTAALNPAFTYNKISVFFNFGTTGAMAGAKTYYFDDIVWIGGTGGGTGGGNFVDLTFDDAAKTYTFTSFGGSVGTVVVDPTNASNMVGEVVKSNTAELWAGVTPSTGAMDSVEPFPFDASNTRLTVRVWSPDANVPVRVKVEDSTNAAVSVETEVVTTVAGAWETLTFDFATQAMGTAALDVNATYDKVNLFFNFGTTGAMVGVAKTYYFDDIVWIGGGGTGSTGGGNFSTVTFDDSAITYALTGFGGAEMSTVVVDPTDSTNMVAEVVKNATAELWAGTTLSTGPMQSVGTIPIAAGMTQMNVRVWSPVSNIPVRLKIEDSTDPTRSVETEAMFTATASTWQVLTFNFANQAMGTAAVNFTYTYDKASIFFDFGTTGAMAGGARTYYFDDVAFGP